MCLSAPPEHYCPECDRGYRGETQRKWVLRVSDASLSYWDVNGLPPMEPSSLVYLFVTAVATIVIKPYFPSLPQRSVLSTPVGKGAGLNVTVDIEVNLTSFASF